MSPIKMHPHPDRTSPPFDFSRLKARWAREREESCLASELLLVKVRSAAVPVLASYGVTRAWLFGSIAEGRAGPGSDVDLLVLGVGPAAYWDLRRDLERALGLSLDLFTQDDDPVFVAKIMARGQAIYGKEP
jgi:predicted nucleotidyltransferase